VARTLKITPTESVTIRASTPEMLEVVAAYGPTGKQPPKHYHPSQDEHFEVLEGSVRVRAGDQDGTLRAGERIDIPRRTVHQMWNPGTVESRVLWQTRPYSDVFRLAARPEPVVRGMLAVLAPLGRLRGYGPT
jgi:mannose-6-phosphate isomerase-like protein (cupin superfamily)